MSGGLVQAIPSVVCWAIRPPIWRLFHVKHVFAGVVASVGLLVSLGGVAQADPSNVGKIKIVEYGFNAPGTDTNGNRNSEFVRLTNPTAAAVEVEGWLLHDSYKNGAGDWGNRYVFKATDLPTGSAFRDAVTGKFTVPPGGTVYVYQGSGVDTTPTNSTAAVYRNHSHIWNNGGDTIYVRDLGGDVVSWVRYDGYRVRIG